MLTSYRLIRRADRASDSPVDTITLTRDERHKRRFRTVTDGGRELIVDLAEPAVFSEGDAFEVEGGLIEVRAAPEPLIEISGSDPLVLARIAWHLGNRHTPTEITSHAVYIQPDHVLTEMVRRLGAGVAEVVRPFDPEGGAYAHAEGHGTTGHTHGHRSHGHGHGH